jgi:hypothetical protein
MQQITHFHLNYREGTVNYGFRRWSGPSYRRSIDACGDLHSWPSNSRAGVNIVRREIVALVKSATVRQLHLAEESHEE